MQGYVFHVWTQENWQGNSQVPVVQPYPRCSFTHPQLFVNKCSCDVYLSFLSNTDAHRWNRYKGNKPEKIYPPKSQANGICSESTPILQQNSKDKEKRFHSALLISYLANMRRSSGFWAAGTLRIASRSCSNKLARRFSVILLFRGESPPGINSALELSMLGLVRVMSSLLAIRAREKDTEFLYSSA